MSQPIWSSNAGFIGNFSSTLPFNYVLRATPVYPALVVNYIKLNGTLPEGISVFSENNNCIIKGIPKGVTSPINYKFTIRATDEIGNISDRTFSFTLLTASTPKFKISSGDLLSVTDSVFVNFQIELESSIENLTGNFFISSGELPPGLSLEENTGIIRGYPLPPVGINNQPTIKTYQFTINFASVLGIVYAIYNITVSNFQITSSYANPRFPAILNYAPLKIPVDITDPYYDYYLTPGQNIPILKSGDFFTFKIIGHDFDGGTLTYNFDDLPAGLIGDTRTGWITGIVNLGFGISEYVFKVHVIKNTNFIMSEIVEFKLQVYNGVTNDIVWSTANNLGVLINNSVSYLSVKANSTYELSYRVTAGNLPPTLTLNTNGEIQGKIPFQPTSRLSKQNEVNNFEFTIEAFTPEHPLVKSQRTFYLSIIQYFNEVTENVYIKATPPLSERNIISLLLNDEEIIPTQFLYRPTDENFGKAKNVSFVHAYGIKASTLDEYIEAIKLNHYWRNITLGTLKTAIARDENGDIQYEVVYSEIIDDYINEKNVSINESIRWPTNVSEERGPYLTSESFLYTSFGDLNFPLPESENIDFVTSLSPGSTKTFYPASLTNMKRRIEQNLGVDTDPNLLPKWMTTQQLNESVLGYVRAWVICYTIPGKSEEILNNIINNFPYNLNLINFVVNKYYVDKSSTFNYNSYLSIPGWESLPSGYPKPVTSDSKDLIVSFPQKTIIP